MAKGLKLASKESNGILHDQSITNSQGGVGGIPQFVTGTGVKTIKVQFRTAANVLMANAYIITQKGAHKFLVANATGAVNGYTQSNASATVCRLVAGTNAATPVASTDPATMIITGYNTSNVAFYASRITNKFVYDFSGNKYRYRSGGTNGFVATSTFANVVVH